jgi:biopolymer transport protein ExbD
MATRGNYDMSIDMTPMIDCVFQLMIFFIVTFKLDNDQIDPLIKLAMSPHGQAIEKKDPGTMIIEVTKTGVIKVSGYEFGLQDLYNLVKGSCNQFGAQNVKVLIRADKETIHQHVRTVMDKCAEAGVYKLTIAGMKSQGS